MIRRALLVVLLCSCTKTLAINLDIVPACDQQDALDGMQGVTLEVEGDDLDTPRTGNFSYDTGKGRVPQIPPTVNAQITFLARRGSADSPVDVAGAAGPYDFSGTNSTVGTNVRMVVGRTGTFAGTSSGSRPSKCTSMVRERQRHTATLLKDGRVLIAGGEETKEGALLLLRNTEIYSPEFGTFTVGPDMPEGRSLHTASLLPSGHVLLCGGKGAVMNRQVALATCAVFDPSTATFLDQEILLNVGRMQHRAVTLDDGRVVLFGGVTDGNVVIATTELYDPAAEPVQRLAPSANMLNARAEHTATALNGDSVLITGGRSTMDVLGQIEVWSSTGSRKLADGLARYGHAAGRAGDGRVVIAGGYTNLVDQSMPFSTGAIEIYDPIGLGSVACASSLALGSPRGDLFGVALPRTADGVHRVLFGGGTLQNGIVSGVTETVTLSRGRACTDAVVDLAKGGMAIARTQAVVTPLFGGDLLLTGGGTQTGADSKPSAAGELFFVPR